MLQKVRSSCRTKLGIQQVKNMENRKTLTMMERRKYGFERMRSMKRDKDLQKFMARVSGGVSRRMTIEK